MKMVQSLVAGFCTKFTEVENTKNIKYKLSQNKNRSSNKSFGIVFFLVFFLIGIYPVLNSNDLVIISQDENYNFSEYSGVVKDTSFTFKIISWNAEKSLLHKYVQNRKIAKCVKGYFNFAVSKYLNNINF